MPVRKDTLEHSLPNLATGTHTLVVHALLAKLVLRVLEPPDLGAGRDAREEEETADSNGKADAAVCTLLENAEW